MTKGNSQDANENVARTPRFWKAFDYIPDRVIAFNYEHNGVCVLLRLNALEREAACASLTEDQISLKDPNADAAVLAFERSERASERLKRRCPNATKVWWDYDYCCDT